MVYLFSAYRRIGEGTGIDTILCPLYIPFSPSLNIRTRPEVHSLKRIIFPVYVQIVICVCISQINLLKPAYGDAEDLHHRHHHHLAYWHY